MNRHFIKFLLLLAVPCISYARNREATVHIASVSIEFTHPLKADEHNEDHYNHFGLLNIATIYRAQTQKDNNYKRLPGFCTTTGQISCNIAERSVLQTAVPHVCSCKLILFPFHDFW